MRPALLPTLLLSIACTVSLSPKASAVRQVSLAEVTNCTPLGTVSGTSMQTGLANKSAGEANARNEAIEKAAAMGATHVADLQADYAFSGINAHGIAYRCPEEGAAPARAVAVKPASRQPLVEKGRIAVLDFHGVTSGLNVEQTRYFADEVRGEIMRVAPHLEVITRENLLVLLRANGRDPANCEGECEVETGRLINADAVVSGDILKVGTRYKLSMKLHGTQDGRLLGTAIASGSTIDELDDKTRAAVETLMFTP